MPLFVPLDVDYASDPKMLRLKNPLAELLYIRALCFAKRTLSDGFIDDAQVPLLCHGFGAEMTRRGRGTDALVTRLCLSLCTAGLWTRDANGYVIAAWSKRNMSASAVKAAVEKRRLAGLKGNHDRWHVNGKGSSDCPFCIRFRSDSDDSSDPIRSDSDSPEVEPETEPEVSPSSRSTTSSSSTGVTAEEEANVLSLFATADMGARSVTSIRSAYSYRRKLIENAAAKYGTAVQAYIDAHPDASTVDVACAVMGLDRATALAAWRQLSEPS
jgi:hypothetical protein